MACAPEVLHHVPLFELLDEDETAILATQVEMREFAARQGWELLDQHIYTDEAITGARDDRPG